MEKLKSDVVITFLKKNCDELNRLFEYYKIEYPGLDGEMFLEIFIFFINKLTENCPKLFTKIDDSVSSFLLALYVFLLEASSKYLINIDTKITNILLSLLIKYISIFFNEPEKLLRDTTNCLINLKSYGEIITDNWFDMMNKYSFEHISSDEYYEIGLVYSWLSGAVLYRDAALLVFEKNPNKISKFLKLKNTDFQKIKNSLWYDAKKTANKNNFIYFKSISGFTGFNGHFESPPKIQLSEYGVIISTPEYHYRLFFDIFGDYLEPINDIKNIEFINTNSTIKFNEIGITIEDKEILWKSNFSFLNKTKPPYINPKLLKSYIFVKNTLIFTLKNSYKLYILGLYNE